jgi:hypothetical protein
MPVMVMMTEVVVMPMVPVMDPDNFCLCRRRRNKETQDKRHQ